MSRILLYESVRERRTMQFDDSPGKGTQDIAESEIGVSVTIETVLVLLGGSVKTVIESTAEGMMGPHSR